METHGQWVGLRLRKTNVSGQLVKVHFSPRVADFVRTRVSKSRFSSDLFGFFCSSVGLQLQTRVCVEEAGPRLLSGHALFT